MYHLPNSFTPGSTFTLAEALAAEELPEEYFIVDEAGNLFDGQEFAAGAEAILDGAAGIEIDGAINLGQFHLINDLATFVIENLTFDLADFLENLLTYPEAAALAQSYELWDAEGTDFGRVTEEEAALIEGAANYAEGFWDYTIGVVGETFTLTAGLAGETLVGTANDDTFIGDKDSIDATDKLIDGSTVDNDTANLSFNGDLPALTVVNIENVNVEINNIAAAAAQDVDASNFEGVKNLTVVKGDVVVGGSTLNGNKDMVVTGLNASKVDKFTTGADTKALTLTQATKAGIEIDASTATGAIAVTGAGTLNADLAASTVAFTALGNATEDAKNIVSNTALATSVTTAVGFTGEIAINAAKASTVTVNNATGGVTIDAGTTSTADTTITVNNIDSSGATIVTGTGSSKTAEKEIAINLDGTGASTDVATVSGAGYISLDANTADLVETLNLSGNGAAVTYNMVTPFPTAYNLTGDQDITIINTAAAFAAATLTDSTTAGTTTAKVMTGDDADLSKIGADVIQLGDDGTAAVYKVATGANIMLASDQTDIEFQGKAAGATVNIETADDTNASGAVIDISVGAFTADTNVTTLNLMAAVGKFTATGTTLNNAGTTATTLNIMGTKDVTLGTVVAKEVKAEGFTGKLNLTSATTSKITSGTGNDTIVLNDTDSNTTQFTVDAGDGNNNITVTNAKAASAITTGAGTDTVAVATAAAIVVATGAGNDTVTINHDVDSDGVFVGGDGTDTLVIADTDGNDFSNNANFTFNGFEVLDITAGADTNPIIISAAQFNNQTFTLKGNSATNDVLKIVDVVANANTTIDASNVTIDTTNAPATLILDGGNGNDTITGSSANDIILGGFGADIMDGGAGTDTYDVSAGLVGASAGTGSDNVAGIIVNLGTTDVSEASIQAKTGLYLGGSATVVASGTSDLGYAADKTTNFSEVDTLSNIQNVVGSAGNDYIVAATAGSVITGGAGDDYLVGGASADTFMYATGTDGADTIISFTSGTDKFNTDFVTSKGTLGAGTTVIADVAPAVGAVTLDTSATDVFEITGAALQAAITDYSSGAQVLAAISGTSVSVNTEGDTALMVLYDGGNAYLYEVEDNSGADGGGTALLAADITLIGTFETIADGGLVAADFI